MSTERVSLAQVALVCHHNPVAAWHHGKRIDQQQFSADVTTLVGAITQQPQHHYALYHQDAYPFVVMLFALFHAGKQAWIPGNNCPATAEKLRHEGCHLLGQWGGKVIMPERVGNVSLPLKPLVLQQAQLTIFTSGSSGQPKAINKSLLQLQREVEVLEQQWGVMVGRGTAVATVSHQHIYGLLFRLLWPLASGRCFHSTIYLSPEPMLRAVASDSAYWVASPAQLKRLDDQTEWRAVARLKGIFSSGGALAVDVAQQIEAQSGQQVVEIYGSSETGGIGWRRTVESAAWQPFPGVGLTNRATGETLLQSPFLADATPFKLDDRIELQADGGFILGGRLDRIVKVEEKRLSLDELEQALKASEWIDEAHSLLLSDKRDRIAVIIVLTESGRTALSQQGRLRLIRQLRTRLLSVFEPVVLPRQWLFINTLPLTPQGKINNSMVRSLLMLDATKFPQLLGCQLAGNRVQLELRIRPELIYFDGHFPEQPIVPGVVQLAWAECYGKLLLAIDQPFLMMEVIKFKKIIQPGALITISLEWKASTGKLYFELRSAINVHSSGRMVYGVHR